MTSAWAGENHPPSVHPASVRPPSVRPAALRPPSVPTLNRSRLSDLERDISREFLLELVGVFISDFALRLEWLGTATRARESKRARDLAHALQGSAASLGVPRLRSVAQRLEERIEHDDWAAVDELFTRLGTEFQHARQMLAEFSSETRADKQ